jgi:hypothetical protein
MLGGTGNPDASAHLPTAQSPVIKATAVEANIKLEVANFFTDFSPFDGAIALLQACYAPVTGR